MAIKIIIDSNDDAVVDTSINKALTTDVPLMVSLTSVTLPRTVTAVDGNVSKMVRYGKCDQASTPTPTSPVDIICNVGAVREGMMGELLFTQCPSDPDEIPPDMPFETLRIFTTNLVPADSFEQGSFSSGVEYNDEPYYSTRVRTKKGIPVKTNTQYTVSGETTAGTQYIYVYQFKPDGYTSAGWNSLPYTFTTSATTQNVRFLLAKATDTSSPMSPDDVVFFQLEEGSSATTFNGYASVAYIPPLLSNGAVKDEENVLTGVITRRISYIVFTGAEIGTWTAFDAANGIYMLEYPTGSAVLDEKVDTYLLCTHFNCISPSAEASTIPDGGCKTHTSSHYWYFRKQGITSVSDWVDWLQSQYDAGTPVIVVYEKAAAESDVTDYYKMYTLEGSNKIESTSPVNAIIDMIYNNG